MTLRKWTTLAVLLVAPGLAAAQEKVISERDFVESVKVLSREGSELTAVTFPDGTPLRDLLPAAPAGSVKPKMLFPRTLRDVHELAFHEPLEKNRDKSLTYIRNTIGKINHLNVKKMDQFMYDLIEQRDDLKGMPFLLGGACRKAPEIMASFQMVLNHVRGSLPGEFSGPLTAEAFARREVNEGLSDSFWQTFTNQINADPRSSAKRSEPKAREMFRMAQVAALMQVCGPEAGPMKRGMSRHISAIPHADSSRALAKLAVFAPEEEVRRDAVEALKVRKDKDYNDILVAGLRYPWPQVAKNAVDAIVTLERRDLMPMLIDVLGEEDQRLPRTREEGGKSVTTVREMVKLNHHRNCFMCHPPVNPDSPPSDVLTGAVPVPGEPLPSFSEGYRNSTPNLAVRIDATYLRQDFSIMIKVDDANPWPEMQRFDYLVRTRTVDADEAREYVREAGIPEPGVLNPYHRAAVWGLRELTGRDAAPTADAWRKIVRLPG